MAIVSCNECKNDISNTAKSCPHCGAKVPRAPTWLWVIGALVAMFVVFLAFGAIRANTPEGKAKSKARAVISTCWKQQSDKSLTPDSQRFIASVCQKMENDFRDKYRVNP